MILDICCIVSVLLLIGVMFVLAMALGKINKKLKELKDNQFDAEQVMALYAKKYNQKPTIISEKPTIISENRKNIVDLYANVGIPFAYKDEVAEEEVLDKLVKEMAKQIFPYMKIEKEKDIATLENKYFARLRVCEK